MMRVAVVNPGTHPELVRVATALIGRGEEVHYATAASFSADEFIMRALSLPSVSGWSIAKQLARRKLPPGMTRANVVRRAFGSEVMFQASKAAGLPMTNSLMRLRNKRFERSIANYLRGHPVDVVIAQYTAAFKAFRAAGDRPLKVLGYPIPHHRWMTETLAEEAANNPAWAGYLQGHDYSAGFLAKLDAEASLADLIVVPSSFVRDTFISNGIAPEKIAVVPLGAHKQDPSFESAPARDPARLRVIFAGQINQRKGISYLLEAIRNVPEVDLILVGATSPGMISKLTGEPRVTVLPSQPQRQLRDLLRSSDVLALPSLADGFGLVALEAMVEGTPCVVSTFSFGSDVITDGVNGFVIAPSDSDELSRVLTTLSRDPNLLARISSAAKTTGEYFTWQRFEDRFVEAISIPRSD